MEMSSLLHGPPLTSGVLTEWTTRDKMDAVEKSKNPALEWNHHFSVCSQHTVLTELSQSPHSICRCLVLWRIDPLLSGDYNNRVIVGNGVFCSARAKVVIKKIIGAIYLVEDWQFSCEEKN
jgi:hypothetical protein